MMRRLAALSVLVLCAALAAGCSRSSEGPKPTPARPLSAIWPEVLAQRDALHALMVKPLEEVTHEDCQALGAGARRVDGLINEILAYVPSMSGQNEGKLRAIGEGILNLQGVVGRIRESALAEAPGQWPAFRFPLDQALRGVESFFTPEELGGQSVAAKPDFETKPIPPPLSPV